MFRLTNVIPERIIFVSRGITVQETATESRKIEKTVSSDFRKGRFSSGTPRSPLPPATLSTASGEQQIYFQLQ